MGKQVYNKLVRDRIPEIIRADGKRLKSRILDDAELAEAQSVEEMADVHEVLIALADALNINPDELEKV